MAPGWAVLVLLALVVLSPPRVCGAGLEPGQWVWGAAGRVLPLPRGKRDHGGQGPGATTAVPGHGHAATTLPSRDQTDGGSVPPPAPCTNASLPRVPTTAHPMNETDSPDPNLLLSSAPPPAVPGTNASQLRARTAPTTEDPSDETDTPSPDLLLDSEPGPSAAPQQGTGTTPTAPGQEGTVAGGLDSTSSPGPPSAASPALGATTTGYRKAKKAPADTTPAMPWDPSGVMGKCLLAILLLGLVAATFLVCSGVLGALLWRRARSGQRRLSRTEMVCISSLLADAEAAAGPRPVPARRHKRLLDGSAEPDGDNLTLSSFLPEHS